MFWFRIYLIARKKPPTLNLTQLKSYKNETMWKNFILLTGKTFHSIYFICRSWGTLFYLLAINQQYSPPHWVKKMKKELVNHKGNVTFYSSSGSQGTWPKMSGHESQCPFSLASQYPPMYWYVSLPLSFANHCGLQPCSCIFRAWIPIKAAFRQLQQTIKYHCYKKLKLTRNSLQVLICELMTWKRCKTQLQKKCWYLYIRKCNITCRCLCSSLNFSAFAISYSPFSRYLWSGLSLESVGGNFSCMSLNLKNHKLLAVIVSNRTFRTTTIYTR